MGVLVLFRGKTKVYKFKPVTLSLKVFKNNII